MNNLREGMKRRQTRKVDRFELNPAEETFVREWRRANAEMNFPISFDDALLAAILDPERQGGRGVSIDDATAQAAEEIIQWLGTPVGLKWLGETISKLRPNDRAAILASD